MTKQVAIVSHADADGHLIAEQTRRNLSLISNFNIDVFVDQEITNGHHVWYKLDKINILQHADIIFFVDLMFSPEEYKKQAESLEKFASQKKQTKIFILDHHPLPLSRLYKCDNVRSLYRRDVFDCTFGPRSGMMVVAAICENQKSTVIDVAMPYHELICTGMRRASALGGQLPGEKLLELLKFDYWNAVAALGREPTEFHYLPRGRRSPKGAQSATLKELNLAAGRLIADRGPDTLRKKRVERGRMKMPYDFDDQGQSAIVRERFSYDDGRKIHRHSVEAESEDLEVIVTLLEVAALSLTPVVGATFTFEQLAEEVNDLSEGKIKIHKHDLKNVLGKAGFLRRKGASFVLK